MFRFNHSPALLARLAMIAAIAVSAMPADAQTWSSSENDPSKYVEHSAKLSSGGWVEIHNEYGDLHVNTEGSTGEVKIKARLDANGDDQDAAKLLERLKLNIDENAGKVVIKGGLNGEIKRMTDNENGTKIVFNDGEKLKVDDFTIDIWVTMPRKANLEIYQTFGDIEVGDLEGELQLKSSYSDFELGSIKGKVEINPSFADGTAEFIQEGHITLEYGDMEIEEAFTLFLESSFSGFEIGRAELIKSTRGYNDYEIEYVNAIELDEEFSELEIDELGIKGEIEITYGSIELKMKPGFEALEIDADFGEIEIELPEDDEFKLDLYAEMGEINFPKHLEIQTDDKGMLSRHIIAHNKEGSKLVKLHSSYGSMKVELD